MRSLDSLAGIQGTLPAITEQYRTLQQIVLAALRQAILSGSMPPGQKLTVKSISDRVAVSAMPVRQALLVLEAEGFVAGSPHKGFVVASISIADVEELYLLRIALEKLAVGLGVAVGVITETILVRHLGYGKADVFTTRAGDVMVREFTVCQPTDFLPDVLAKMHERGLIHVPVVDDNNRPIGVVNARDGLRALLAQGNFEEALLRNYVMGIGYQ